MAPPAAETVVNRNRGIAPNGKHFAVARMNPQRHERGPGATFQFGACGGR
jgi:hypothetical protein